MELAFSGFDFAVRRILCGRILGGVGILTARLWREWDAPAPAGETPTLRPSDLGFYRSVSPPASVAP